MPNLQASITLGHLKQANEIQCDESYDNFNEKSREFQKILFSHHDLTFERISQFYQKNVRELASKINHTASDRHHSRS